MGKNTFGKTMPRALSQNLKIMGEQIMLARKYILRMYRSTDNLLLPYRNIPALVNHIRTLLG